MVDTLNVWEEKLPDFDQQAHWGEVQRRVQTTDGPGRDRRLGQNPGAGSYASRQADRIVLGRAYVETSPTLTSSSN